MALPHHNRTAAAGPRGEKPEIPGDAGRTQAISHTVHDDTRDLAAALAGDQEAFARIYDRHAAVVLSLCRRHLASALGADRTDHEDALQETFIRAHARIDQLDCPGKLRSWLYAIARRVCSERRRSAARRQKHEALAMTQATLNHVPRRSAPERAQHDEQLERLDEALDQLDDRERLAVHLYYLDADPVQAAADALGLSRSGYYKLLTRARQRLRSLMHEVQPS